MGWTLKKPWKKHSEVSNTRETQVGPNSFRINVVKKGEEADKIKPQFSYSEQFLSRKAERKAAAREESRKFDAKATISSYGGDDYYDNYDEAYGYGGNYRRGIIHRPMIQSTYRAPAVKKEFAWEASRWNNFTYYVPSYDNDDNSNLFIKEPEGYMTPTAIEIRSKIHVYTSEPIGTIKELCRLLYFKMLDNKEYIDKTMKDRLSSDEYQKKKDLYSAAYNTYIPGFSPLEQAVNYYQAILDKRAFDNAHKDSRSPGNEIVTFKREHFTDPALNCQLKYNSLNSGHKIEILNKVSLVGQLGQQFQVEKETGEKVVANSDVYKKRVMRDYAQIDRVNIYQRALPNFNLKFLTKNLIVDVPVKTSEKKQKIIILLDYSGSMNNTPKQKWVNALLMDRLKYVIKGEAEVYFSRFVSTPDGLHFKHLKNAKDVDEFWKTFDNYPSGGCTDMGRIVEYVSKEVKGGKKLHNLKNLNLSHEKPEILIINDGQDHVGRDAFPYKVNAISLYQFSDELKNLCVNTGGKQVRIISETEIRSYSSEAEETITPTRFK